MPKYILKFEVESNDYCGIVERGRLASDEIDFIMDSNLSSLEKYTQLDGILVNSEEFQVVEEAVRESAEEEYHKGDEDDEDMLNDLNSTSRFSIYLGDDEVTL